MSSNFWNPELCMKLINEYKQKPELWDRKHEYHFNKSEKQEVWKDLANNLNIDVEKVKTKINSILASFRRERTKIRKARLERPYVSHWYAFKALHFLLNNDDYNKLHSMQNVRNSENYKITPDFEESSNGLDLNKIDGQIVIKEHGESQRLKNNNNKETEYIGSSQCICENNEKNCAVLDEIKNNENMTVWKEECNAFGQYIANKLHQYDLRTRAFAEHAISNVIFEADMGKFDNDAASSNSDNLFLSYVNLEHTTCHKEIPNTV